MTPDLILTNARIRTMDPARPWAQALAVGAGRILVLGSDAEIRALAGPGTRRTDAGGRLCLPGFQDAHIHLLNGGTDLVETAPLYDCTTLEEVRAALAAHAARWPGPVVWGAGWQPGFFGDANLTRAVLDAAVPGRPCLAYDSSFHIACVNSAAITRIGLADDTPDPPNGRFVRDAAGRATGMLHEEAISWATARLPVTTDDTLRDGVRAGQALANRHGITGVLDPAVREEHRRIYAAAEAAGELTLRVGGAIHVTADEPVAEAVARATDWRASHRSPDFHLHSVKVFMDGGFENRTAATLAPYSDAPGGTAPLMFAPEHTAALFAALDAARFQIHVHCIGDAATRATLDGIAAARAANGAWPGLHQLAHLQVMAPADFARLAALGAMANIQPLWARHDTVVPDEWIDMIGPDRLPRTYAFRQMLDAGAPFCLSSDFPVSTLNPFEIIETAVTRQPRRRDGNRPPFLPAERLTVAEAVAGYTCHAARACWRGEDTGRLLPGFSADLVVLDRDLFRCAAHEIGDTEVLVTLFRGEPVWRHEAFHEGDFA